MIFCFILLFFNLEKGGSGNFQGFLSKTFYIMKNNTLNWPRITTWTLSILLLGFLIQTIVSCNQNAKVRQGAELYASYCQVCHGEGGQIGPMADLLKNPPPDLTLISQRNGGKFPTDQISIKVAGKQDIAGHGASDMPVFWVAIKNGENLEEDREVEERINEIVAYLRRIQQ